ncbi:MAG: hypothetical protein GY774_25690 [Planctomycetes bacterium]|nr:hypothetical protein [Planctomycetota bacterium]
MSAKDAPSLTTVGCDTVSKESPHVTRSFKEFGAEHFLSEIRIDNSNDYDQTPANVIRENLLSHQCS